RGAAGGEHVAAPERTALVASERRHEERAAPSQNNGHTDAAADGDVLYDAVFRGSRAGPYIAGRQTDRRAVVGRDDRRRVRAEHDRSDDLDRGLSWGVLDRRVGARQLLGDERSARRDALVHVPGAAAVLHETEAGRGDDLQHG